MRQSLQHIAVRVAEPIETTPRSISLRLMRSVVFDSIQEVPKAEWNRLLGNRHIIHSFEFWQVVERAALNDFNYRHVLFYDDDERAVALASLYTVTTDIAIFASGRLQKVLQRGRQVFPNFLKLRMLECGTPIALNRPFVVGEEGDESQVAQALHQLIRKTLRREGQKLVVIRDFEAGSKQVRRQLLFQKLLDD